MVKKLEAENRKLIATILSITAVLRNVNDNQSNCLNEIQRDIDDEVARFLVMFIVATYAVIMVRTFA